MTYSLQAFLNINQNNQNCFGLHGPAVLQSDAASMSGNRLWVWLHLFLLFTTVPSYQPEE